MDGQNLGLPTNGWTVRTPLGYLSAWKNTLSVSKCPGRVIRVARRICEWGFPLMMIEGSRISQSRRSGWLGYIRRWDVRAGVFLSGGSRFDLKGL